MGCDQQRIGNHSERRSRPETRCGEADRKAAAVGEPLHRVADAGGVNPAGPNARQHRREIEQRKRIRDGVDRPADTDQDAAKATISFGPRGPRLSTIQPSIGVSQVSSATKMLKANWISAIDQPAPSGSGRINSVQPYCRLAISAMQTTPMASCRTLPAFGAPTAADACIAIHLSPVGPFCAACVYFRPCLGCGFTPSGLRACADRRARGRGRAHRLRHDIGEMRRATRWAGALASPASSSALVLARHCRPLVAPQASVVSYHRETMRLGSQYAEAARKAGRHQGGTDAKPKPSPAASSVPDLISGKPASLISPRSSNVGALGQER